MSSSTIETPSGKGAGDENFPVGSFLIKPALRRHVMALYGFARAADDIADNPALEADDKVERLATLGRIVTGDITGDDAMTLSWNAVRLRASLLETRTTPQHCLDLLAAFTQDARKSRYETWDDLIGYCLLSASPIGRHLLDLHGEDSACRAPSDALCNALQIVNHLQDCGVDYVALDRVYLPLSDMAAEGAAVEALGQKRLTPAMRATLDRVIRPLRTLLDQSRDLVTIVRDPRIALECGVIHAMCTRLTERLGREDPLATRVVLSKPAAAKLAAGAVISGLWKRRRDPPRRPVLAA